MEQVRPVSRMICHVCQRPALTLDEARIPYCPRHAALVMGAHAPTEAPEELPEVDRHLHFTTLPGWAVG